MISILLIVTTMLFRLLWLIIKFTAGLICRVIKFPFKLIFEELSPPKRSGYEKKQKDKESENACKRRARQASDNLDSDGSDNRAGGGRSGLFLDHAVADNSPAGHRLDNDTD